MIDEKDQAAYATLVTHLFEDKPKNWLSVSYSDSLRATQGSKSLQDLFSFKKIFNEPSIRDYSNYSKSPTYPFFL